MPKLTIQFRGLTMLVRLPDGRIRVVLPNGLEPRLSKLDNCCRIEEHYPNVAIPEALIKGDAVNSANFYARVRLGDAFEQTQKVPAIAPSPTSATRNFVGIFLVPYHEIQVGTVVDTELHVDEETIDATMAPTDKTGASLHWTVDLPRIAPKSAKVKKEVLSPNPPTELVCAYMDLAAGTVTAGDIDPNEVYRFLNVHPDVSQRLAFNVTAELKVDQPSITLRDRRPTPNDEEPDSLTIPLVDDQDSVVIIDSAPLDELLGASRAIGIAQAISGQPYHHFEVLYDLFDNPEAIVIPVAPQFQPHLDPPFSRCAPLTMGG